MHRVLHTLPIILLGLHLCLLVAINVDGWRQGYDSIIDMEQSRWGAILQQHPAVAIYTHYTGLLCGYGFFAPRVGSTCYLEVGLYDIRSQQTEAVDASTLLHAAGYIRYRSFANIFYELLPERIVGQQGATIRQQIAKASAHAIGERVARQLNKELLYCRVYVYRHPTLREKQGKGTLIQLYAHDFGVLPNTDKL